jgi:hypothetical protein
MNYKDKFLQLIGSITKSKAFQEPAKLNGKYISYLERIHKIKVEEWFKDGQLHRENGPALIHINGKRVIVEEWYRNGKLHRDDGPAMQEEEFDKWYKNGELHREDGPAIYINHDHGDVESKYYLNGIEYQKENFENAKKKLHLNNELNQELQTVENKPTKKLKI